MIATLRPLFVVLLIATPIMCRADDSTVGAVARNYSMGANESYMQVVKSAEEMRQGIMQFLDSPTTESMQKAREAWKESHRLYSITEAFRFYGGPIDAPRIGPEPFISSWPIEESYIDYVEGNTSSGIINTSDTVPMINAGVLASKNKSGGEKNVSTGYHAIEFLLWGQDPASGGAGQRPPTDYLPDNPAAQRRADYLRLATGLLVGQLRQVQMAWSSQGDTYASKFNSEEPTEQVRRMITGIAMLAGKELSQNRLTVPMESRDSKHQPSRFSDTTLSDLRHNVEGIRRVYSGTFDKVSGPGISYLVRLQDAELDTRIVEQINVVAKALEAIPVTFDQALTSEDGRAKIGDAVKHLETLTDLIVTAAAALGVTVAI